LQNALETERIGDMGEGLVMIPCLIRVESSCGTKTRMGGEIGMGIKNRTVNQLERRNWRWNVHIAWVMGPKSQPSDAEKKKQSTNREK